MAQAPIALARHLRKNSTDVEKLLWRHLRNRQAWGVKFRRQQTFGPYVLDFFCAELALVIEVDGGQHQTPQGIHKDQQRSAFLLSKGVTIFRVSNHDVLQNMEGVLQGVGMEIEAAKNKGEGL